MFFPKPGDNTSLWDLNFKHASRPRPPFIEEFNNPRSYSYSRLTKLNTMKRARDAYPEKYEAAKRRRMQSRQASLYRSLPRGRPVSNTALQRAAAQEIKSVDVVNPNGTGVAGVWTLNTTATITALNLITSGSASWQRVGRKVHLKSVHIRGYVNIGNPVAQEDYGRMMVVYDKQPNGALPTIQDILLDQINSGTDVSLSQRLSGINLNNRDRFEILRDQQFWLPPTANTSFTLAPGVAFPMTIKMFIDLKGRETTYRADSSPGVIGDISTGSLLLITFGNYASGTEGYNLALTSRVRFYD